MLQWTHNTQRHSNRGRAIQEGLIGEANVFVSHMHGAKFTEMVGAVERHAIAYGIDSVDCFPW